MEKKKKGYLNLKWGKKKEGFLPPPPPQKKISVKKENGIEKPLQECVKCLEKYRDHVEK